MKEVYKIEIWQAGSKKWYCADIKHMTKWWVIPKMLGITLEEYIKMLLDKYQVDNIMYSEKTDVLIFSWDKERFARMFKNDVNRIARNKHFCY